jgi:hypothetical protein
LDQINLQKNALAGAGFGTAAYTNAAQKIASLNNQLTTLDYQLAHPAGVLSAAQTAGITQGTELANRMYPSLNTGTTFTYPSDYVGPRQQSTPNIAALMFPSAMTAPATSPSATAINATPYNNSDPYSNARLTASGIAALPVGTTPATPPVTKAAGGIASLAQGGYPRMTGAINGPGTETSDSIPAMLSNNEFVFTAKAVRAAGGGSARQGAKRMYALMHQLERNAARG